MLVPVVDPETGEVILHDIFVDGKWVGSRRTASQCIERLRHLKWPSAVIAANYTISQDEIIFAL